MRRSTLAGIIFGLIALLFLDSIAVRLGIATGIIPRVAGPIPWIGSRALGITAFVALTFEVVFGLLSSSGEAERVMGRARAVDIHRWLSGVTLSLVGAHAAVLVFDRYAGFDILDITVPFVAPTQRVSVGIGVLAAYLSMMVHGTSLAMKRLGPSVWRRLHYASFAVFAAAAVHGLMAGSDSGSRGLQLLYASSVLVVLALTAHRITKKRRAATRPRISGTDVRGATSGPDSS